jgi:uncharacterized membrane protein YedE/YeeE
VTLPYWHALFGGMLIGLAGAMLLLLNGRIAGVSGIVGQLAQGARLPIHGAFVMGLALWGCFRPRPVIIGHARSGSGARLS